MPKNTLSICGLGYVCVDLFELQYNQSYKQDRLIDFFISREPTPRVAMQPHRVEDPYIIKLSLEKMKRKISSKTDIMNVCIIC